jgi:nicotinate-nucleotide adenylyltransferase
MGVFGGTFDPVHNGHLAAAVEARHRLRLDELLVVPAADPWQKHGQVVAAAEDRYAMVKAAFTDVDGVTVSRVELDRDGPTYTVDTLRSLAAPDRELVLVVGADAVQGLATWHAVDEIRNRCELAIVTRAGDEQPQPPDGDWRATVVEIPRLDISSTDLRDRLAAGRPVDGLMPETAIREVAERRLYTRTR